MGNEEGVEPMATEATVSIRFGGNLLTAEKLLWVFGDEWGDIDDWTKSRDFIRDSNLSPRPPACWSVGMYCIPRRAHLSALVLWREFVRDPGIARSAYAFDPSCEIWISIGVFINIDQFEVPINATIPRLEIPEGFPPVDATVSLYPCRPAAPDDETILPS